MQLHGLTPQWRLHLSLRVTNISTCYGMVMSHYPLCRMSVDNVWTHASKDQLLPHMRNILQSLPDPSFGHSHVLWMNWNHKRVGSSNQSTPISDSSLSDMCFSVEDDLYLGVYGMWEKQQDDERYVGWAASHCGALQREGLSSGGAASRRRAA